jgi:hypothetical protein
MGAERSAWILSLQGWLVVAIFLGTTALLFNRYRGARARTHGR